MLISSVILPTIAIFSQLELTSAFGSHLHLKLHKTQSLLAHQHRHSFEATADDSTACESSATTATTSNNHLSRRKMVLSSLASFSAIVSTSSAANARYVLNDETGDYDEVTDEDWQTSWKQRLDKANSMSSDEIFAAARGAGNMNLKEGEESEASKKRRAMSACRDSGIRAKAGVDAKSCNSRVMGGELDFILDNWMESIDHWIETE